MYCLYCQAIRLQTEEVPLWAPREQEVVKDVRRLKFKHLSPQLALRLSLVGLIRYVPSLNDGEFWSRHRTLWRLLARNHKVSHLS